jgi:hypothetical protein
LRHGFCTVSHSLTSPAPLGADRFLVSACPRSTSRSCGCSVPTWPPHFEIRANLATALLRQYCAIVRSHWPEDWSYDAGYRVGEIIVRDEPGLKPNRRISASLKGLWHRQNHGIGKRAPTQRSPPQGGLVVAWRGSSHAPTATSRSRPLVTGRAHGVAARLKVAQLPLI